MKFRSLIAPFAVMAALRVPAAAHAHPKIVAATPAANATVAPTTTVQLTFSERVMPRLSSATLTMTSMPGMANHVMKMTGVTSAVSEDGKSITLTSARPLSAGSYRVDWVIVGADTHRITGTHAFSVR
ncbi:MAG: copper homeostasis periplasmic binding protein CopC [Alphaproteobacteria bacterium]